MSDPKSNTDVLDRIDARGRAAAAGLRGAVATMPVPDAPVRAGRPWLRPALAMAGVLALVAGLVTVLVALANRPADVANPGGPDTRWVLDSPPEGFTVVGAVGPGDGVSGDTSFLSRVDVYTDVSDPTRGALFFDASDAVEDLAGELVDLGTVDGVLSSSPAFAGARAVQFGEGGERRTVLGRGISDQVLVAAATELAAGRSMLAVLPDGFAEYLDVSVLDAGAMAGVVAARGDELPAGLSTVGYTREGDGESLVYLAVQPDTSRAQAALAALLEVTGPVDGLPNGRVVRIGDELQGVVWESGGLLFAVAGTEPVEVLVAAARTARPASDEEWRNLVDMARANSGGDTVTEVTAVAATVPGDQSPWSGEVDGRRWEVRTSAANADVVEVLIDGAVIFTDRRDEDMWLRVFDDGDVTAVYAIVPEGFPGSLEVTTTSGGSSSSPLPAEFSPVRLVATVVPSAEFTSAEWRNDSGEVLLDTLGSVLAFQSGADESWLMAVATGPDDAATVRVVDSNGKSAEFIADGERPAVSLAEIGTIFPGTVTVIAVAPEAGWTLVVHLTNGAISNELETATVGGLAATAVIVDKARVAYVDLIDPTGAVVQRHLCSQPPADGTVPCQ